jgi:hypothetical protein
MKTTLRRRGEQAMSGSAPFRLNRSGMLLALISAAFAGEAGAAAGKVDFATEGVVVAGRDGQARPLGKGAELDSGDTVRTNAAGRAQIRFSDGSYVSLQPNSDFAISDYKYDGKDDDHGFFGLLKGAMRTVTGAVGRVNRNSYRITTPTATVGIRGTGGVIQVLNDGSTLVIGTSGIWSLTNASGSLDIPAGISGLAPREPNTPPHETSTQPQTKPADVPPPKNLDYKKGDDVNDEGQPADVAAVAPLSTPQIVPLVSGSGYQLVSAFNSTVIEGTTVISQTANATFDAAGQLTAGVGPSFTHTLVSGSHADFGTDGILAWGRWVGSVQNCSSGGSFCSTETYNANQGVHYVVGMPTAVMPTTGSATYSLAPDSLAPSGTSATRPTYNNGSSAPGTLLPNSQLMITFGATHTIGANLNVSMSDGQGYNLNGTTTSSNSLFSMSPTVRGTAGSACACGCSGNISGFFAGANAERAGVGYLINDSTSFSQVVGAAAFKRNP